MHLLSKAGATVGIVAAIALVLLAASRGCDLCANTDPETYLSPDGRMKVVVFTRDCGATTDFSTQASVLPASAPLPNDAGNLYIADNNHGTTGHGLALGVRWLDRERVTLSPSSAARVLKAEKVVQGIRIDYRVSP
jgi:hypothetical protein